MKKPTRLKKQSLRAGERIIAGLSEFRDALQSGRPLTDFFTIREVTIIDPELFDSQRVRAVRTSIGVSQSVFAKLIGVSAVLVQSWEQGVRTPAPLARRLLAEIERDPKRWREMISANPVRPTRKSA